MSWAARRKAVLVLLAVFLVGGAAGWVLEEVVDEIHWQDHRGEGGAPDRPDEDEPFDDDAEEDLLEIRNFGQKPIDEVKAKLEDMGLGLKKREL